MDENMSFYETEDNVAGEDGVSSKIEAPVVPDEENTVIVNEDGLALQRSLVISDDFGVDDDALEEDEENSSFSPEERLSGFADQLMSCCVGGGEVGRYALDKLTALKSPAVFRDENYILFSVIFNFRGRLRYIDLDEEFIKLYLNRNRKILTGAKQFIDVNAYGEVDGSAELGYIGGVLKHYKRLRSMPELSKVEFETVYEKYMIEFKALEVDRALKQSKLILNDGVQFGRKTMFGADDSISYFKKRCAEIDGLVKVDSGTGFVTSRELATEEKDVAKPYKIGDFGRIPTLNTAYDGIYTGFMYEFIAPPKAGKSKFTTRLAHNIVVEHGNNITVWAPEGGVDAWFAQFRAIHFDYIYNNNADLKDRKFGVNQQTIINGNYPKEEFKQLEMSSKLDIGTNGNYGTIDFIDKPFTIETFLEDIDTSVKSNNSVAVVIDYLQMLTGEGMSDTEAVSKGYRTLLSYLRRNNIAVITPAQYKQESFNKLIETKSTEGIDLRTAGGVSSEVIRTPDILIAMWATTQDLANGSMKLLSMPCRFAKPFPEVSLAVDLGCCQFIEVGN